MHTEGGAVSKPPAGEHTHPSAGAGSDTAPHVAAELKESARANLASTRSILGSCLAGLSDDALCQLPKKVVSGENHPANEATGQPPRAKSAFVGFRDP